MVHFECAGAFGDVGEVVGFVEMPFQPSLWSA
jgi:hypothetical protein